MEKILYIDACVRERSRTRILGEYLINRLSGDIEIIKLESHKVSSLNRERLELREELLSSNKKEDSFFRFARQFSEADTIVIAAPYWDLSYPSELKVYIENVTVQGISFEYGEDGIPHGLCKAERLIYVMTAGGYVKDHNFGFEYLKSLAENLYGIKQVICIKAEGLDIEGADVEAILKDAESEIETLAGNPSKPQGEAGKEMLHRMNVTHDSVTNWALDKIDFNGIKYIMDVGCGGGATLRRLSNRAPEAHIVGVDYSPVSIEKSGETNADSIEQGRMELVEADVSNLPFKDESFDLIVSIESFYFWKDSVKCLEEIRRVLRKGGTFILVADIYRNDNLPEKALENIKRYYMQVPSVEEFRALFEQAGYTCTNIYLEPGTDWIAVKGSK